MFIGSQEGVSKWVKGLEVDLGNENLALNHIIVALAWYASDATLKYEEILISTGQISGIIHLAASHA